ncbi:hypothetical protein MPNT_50082 [Candidatus Methylacidithermus pantelleriae]|uniref:Uncharacterized protein n=1 Tax=Candidatus Methylacidithermus pantelleriae TaxID=2744239 RepID=A0A8J2FPG1_9BACT|nr:hypothetical protein MPNT_50082 [Candidatus Methylacidithermus pantelleriae]
MPLPFPLLSPKKAGHSRCHFFFMSAEQLFPEDLVEAGSARPGEGGKLCLLSRL